MGLIMTQFHFSKQKMESERPKKASRQRKQSIFDFNHIDPHIQEEELEEIKNLFRFYHKRFWCLKRAHSRFKKMNLLMNLTSSGFGCNRGNCWRRNNESHRSGGDFRSWFNCQNRE